MFVYVRTSIESVRNWKRSSEVWTEVQALYRGEYLELETLKGVFQKQGDNFSFETKDEIPGVFWFYLMFQDITGPRKKIQLFLGSNPKGSWVGPKSATAAL